MTSWQPPAIRTLADELREAGDTDRACRSIAPPAWPCDLGCTIHHRDVRWTGWELCTHTMPGYLVHDDYGYSIELAGITDSAQMLDWIYQIRGKSWTDDHSHLTGLLQAFRDILDPQGSLCSGGRSKRLGKRDITRQVERVLAAWPLRRRATP
jgi:hypothetical protein